ncbi:hypothetical protein JYU34_020417 [Plutella xylostella]|uniref:Uncharacterized protein n=1 Tax=Plutella xylostella TaxID=51655 RepID=A0ABQ7PUF3_PLUXY|nr:hypothetical protein JYU34_020417 [Plutella xylostella]
MNRNTDFKAHRTTEDIRTANFAPMSLHSSEPTVSSLKLRNPQSKVKPAHKYPAVSQADVQPKLKYKYSSTSATIVPSVVLGASCRLGVNSENIASYACR